CSCNGIFKLTPKLAANSTNKTGWTVCGGIETALWGLFSVGHTGIFIVDPVAVSDNLDVRLRSHTATFGLAYKFGDPVAGDFGGASGAFASTATPTAMSWGGFYAGLGLGARVSHDDLRTTALSTAGTATDLSVLATSQPFDGTGFRASPYAGFN